MNVYILITINLLLTALVSYFIVDSNNQFKPFTTQPLCLKQQNTDQLCAKCFRRDASILGDRAFKIQSTEDISVLEIGQQNAYLSCQEYLQFISTQKDSKNQRQISLESLAPISQLFQEIRAIFQTNIGRAGVVYPSYNQFVIYKWGDFNNEQTKVTIPNTENYKNINFYFIYGFNFILVLILVAWVADNTFLAEQSTSIKLCLAFIVVLLELCLFQISSKTCLYLCRLLILNIGLLRLKINNFRVFGVFLVGLFFTYFELTLPIYVFGILLLVFYYGKLQPQAHQFQRYLIILYTFLLANHLYIYNFVFFLNDFRNLAIDLCLIITIPLGLFLLPNEKKFKPYRPVDPEFRSISLSGYDQQEPSNI